LIYFLFQIFLESNLYIQQNQELVQDISQQEIELINNVQNLPNITQTEKNQIVAARIGQGYFRRTLILECGICPITEVDESPLLIASHIKPWKVSDNTERINPKNGILLTPTYDKLFDRGYISFSDDKKLLVSTILSEENRQKLDLINNKVYPLLPVDGRQEFLNFHRNEVYKG
jgi:putative restriction endonuclease